MLIGFYADIPSKEVSIMSKVTKVSPISNYRVVSKSNSKPNTSTPNVGIIHQKSDAHNSPEHRSGNEHHLMDTFYENTYNLKASFNRVTHLNEEKQSLKHYFKAHKREVTQGATALVEDLNRLIQESIQCDYSMGTHFYFLIESILHEFDGPLKNIGIHFHEDCLYLNANFFYQKLVDDYESFTFIFKSQSGLLDRCIQVHSKLTRVKETQFTEGQFIDIMG